MFVQLRSRGPVLLVSLALFLGGCKTLQLPGQNTASQGPSPDPRLANSSEAHFFSKSGLEACGGGALMGLAACKLTNTCDSNKGMLTAALVGCGIGMGTNYYLDQRRSQYASTEQRLNAEIADVQADNRKLQTLTATASDVLKQNKQQLAQIKTQLARKQLAKASAEQQLAKVDANTRYLNTTLADLKKREQQWRQVASSEQANSTKKQQLNNEFNHMQRQISSLQQDVQQVEQQRNAIVLG